jgi:hypothetical protein
LRDFGVPEVPAAAILTNFAGVNAVPNLSPFRRIIRRMGRTCIYGRFRDRFARPRWPIEWINAPMIWLVCTATH